MPNNPQVDLARRKRLRAKFLALQKQTGKNLQSWPDKKSQLRQSGKPIASSDQKKAEVAAEHGQVKRESKLAAKRALDWEPIFPIEEDLPKYRRVVVKGGETANVRDIFALYALPIIDDQINTQIVSIMNLHRCQKELNLQCKV